MAGLGFLGFVVPIVGWLVGWSAGEGDLPILLPKATYQVDCVPREGQGDFCLKCLKCGGFRVFRVCGFDRRPKWLAERVVPGRGRKAQDCISGKDNAIFV